MCELGALFCFMRSLGDWQGLFLVGRPRAGLGRRSQPCGRLMLALLCLSPAAFTKLITVNGQEYHLQLVDTAGQDEYSIFPQTYSIDINGYILVYSVTSIKSFEVIKVIHGKLLDMVGKVQIPIMLVGNKKDLHMERVISYEEGKALAESWNAAFLESSAKENQTAVDVFRRIILEAEKIDGAASQGKSSCSMM
ncbi:Ras-like protein, mTORC1 binding [Phyllostomus discolor]|uniref:GTP-binding protein Rheb n=1 Tax=Phyllostomus discolor TaxID=89673 RepID=A0A833Z616_9CHIR|nr:Ras-like protein, mTORC1 binding [Phyllostomus discolor]